VEQYGSDQAVANILGVSRTTVSLARRGKYNASGKDLAEKVLKTFRHGLGPIRCPFLGKDIDPESCRQYRERAAPTCHPAEFRHWRACRQCAEPDRFFVH
jgi:DNA-binding XRE family transcriptional regulator